MNIGQAGEKANLPPKTIRYYEDIGLLAPSRAANGYRDYSQKDVHRLRFIQRSRGLGFSVEECRTLLALYDDKGRASSDVKDLAVARIAEIERKIADLVSLKAALEELVRHCAGNDRPECPILEDIAEDWNEDDR